VDVIVANYGLCLMRQILWTMTPAAAEIRAHIGSSSDRACVTLTSLESAFAMFCHGSR
jgi:hypothetical protein